MKAGLAVLALAAAPLMAWAQTETYSLDPYHTYPNFMVEHWGLSMISGRFDKSSGRFTLDRAAKTGSVEVVIEAASLTTGDNDRAGRTRTRDEHLRQADFFNVAEFPRISFKSTKVNFAGELPGAVEGNLTLLGVTKPGHPELRALQVRPESVQQEGALRRQRAGQDQALRLRDAHRDSDRRRRDHAEHRVRRRQGLRPSPRRTIMGAPAPRRLSSSRP
ncbi:MAG: YceI family protein [Burkholderiaceae bacterium]|nr:YceI family protein [Burkholderiaceae bacterium]